MKTAYTLEQMQAAVVDAVRAPSLHNSQPWRFRLRDGGIEVSIDPQRRLPATDPTGWGARIACGAAIFNLRLALAVAGTPAHVHLRPHPAEPDVLARLEPDTPRAATASEQSLYAAIARRFSNRAPFWPDPVPADVRWRLAEAARAEGGWLELVIGTSAVAAVAEIAHSANRVLERDPAYQQEEDEWIRSEPAADGISVQSTGPRREPRDLLPQRAFATRHRAPGRDFEPEPLIAVLGSPGDTAPDQVIAGQALQRVLLTATESGLAVSLISQPVEVPGAREQLRLALGRRSAPQMVMRVGYGQPGWPTPRRGIAEVIDPTEPEAPTLTATVGSSQSETVGCLIRPQF